MPALSLQWEKKMQSVCIYMQYNTFKGIHIYTYWFGESNMVSYAHIICISIWYIAFPFRFPCRYILPPHSHYINPYLSRVQLKFKKCFVLQTQAWIILVIHRQFTFKITKYKKKDMHWQNFDANAFTFELKWRELPDVLKFICITVYLKTFLPEFGMCVCLLYILIWKFVKGLSHSQIVCISNR